MPEQSADLFFQIIGEQYVRIKLLQDRSKAQEETILTLTHEKTEMQAELEKAQKP